MIKVPILILAIFSLFNNYNNDEYIIAKNGILYKIIATEQNTDSIKVGDGIAYSLVEKLGDSIGSNSYEQGHQLIRVDTALRDPFNFMFVFSKMKIGDSAHIKLSVDTVYNTIVSANKRKDPLFNVANFKKKLPKFFLQKGEFVEYGVKVLDKFETDNTKPNYKKDSIRLHKFIKQQNNVNSAFEKKQAAKRKNTNDKNIKIGKAFLQKNRTEKGVITTNSGMQYQIIKKGTGPKPTINDNVSCHYVGTTLDGTEFDNSLKRKEPSQFSLTNVIQGWTEVLQLMTVGSKYKVWVPGNLGYGQMGNQGIQPGQLLVFEIELIEIMRKPPKLKSQNKTKNKHSH